MNAISPFSLIDRPQAEHAQRALAGRSGPQRDKGKPEAILQTFSEVWSKADINKDGKLNGSDVVGHVVNAGMQVLGDVFGFEPGAGRAGARSGDRADMAGGTRDGDRAPDVYRAHGGQSAPPPPPPHIPANLTDEVRPTAPGTATPITPALPTMPGLGEIHALYAEMRVDRWGG